VDPVAEIAHLCREAKMWLHIDGAYGGGFTICRNMNGSPRVGAKRIRFIINPHKTLFVPLDFSVLYVRDIERFAPRLLSRAGIFAGRYASRRRGIIWTTEFSSAEDFARSRPG